MLLYWSCCFKCCSCGPACSWQNILFPQSHLSFHELRHPVFGMHGDGAKRWRKMTEDGGLGKSKKEGRNLWTAPKSHWWVNSNFLKTRVVVLPLQFVSCIIVHCLHWSLDNMCCSSTNQIIASSQWSYNTGMARQIFMVGEGNHHCKGGGSRFINFTRLLQQQIISNIQVKWMILCKLMKWASREKCVFSETSFFLA